jgi:hypothetical protein
MYFKARSADGVMNLNLCYTQGNYVSNMNVARVMESLSPTSKASQVQLKVLFSNSGVKEPSEKECSKHFTDPFGKVKLPTPVGQDSYNQEWLYFCFYSPTGCTVSMSVSIAADDRHHYMA